MAVTQPTYVFPDGTRHLILNSDLARFMGRVEKTSTCWNWTGYVTPAGYGRFRVRQQTVRAHRFSYHAYVADVPAGLVIDHLCRNRKCVNPTHLEPVTSRTNLHRGQTINAANAAKTHCPQGHAYTDENTYLGTPRSGRVCKVCNRQQSAARYRALKAGGQTAKKQTPATRCKQGHAFDTENTYVDAIGKRKCRTCMRAAAVKRNTAKRVSK